MDDYSPAKTKEDLAPLKLTKKQLTYIDNYYNPKSETFGNSFQSALAAGFSKNYSLYLMSPARGNKWVEEAKKRLTMYTPDHIYRGLQEVAQTGANRDKLKALELMGKANGMFIDRSQQDVHVTFTNAVPRPESEIIDIEVEDAQN